MFPELGPECELDPQRSSTPLRCAGRSIYYVPFRPNDYDSMERNVGSEQNIAVG